MKKDEPCDTQTNSANAATAPLGLGAITSSAADSQQRLSDLAAKLGALADDAIDALHAGLLGVSDPNTIRAASTILQLWVEFEEAREIERRIALLERHKWKK